MKKFIIDLALIFLVVFILGEFLIRTVGLFGEPIKRENYNGNYLPIPYQNGKMVKGKFKEIDASYSINNLGFNSAIDYSPDLLENKTKIAIIGDSFIEGTHVSVDKSIGRIIENRLPNSIVFEYGVSETNICDYENIYKAFNLDEFDMVFVVFSLGDLFGVNPSSIGTTRKGESFKNRIFRKYYNKSYFLMWLNFNHAIFRRLTNWNPDSEIREDQYHNLNTSFFDKGLNNVIPLYDNRVKEVDIDEYVDFDYEKIEHKLLPYNYGFDQHWNLNGRINVANCILEIINAQNIESP